MPYQIPYTSPLSKQRKYTPVRASRSISNPALNPYNTSRRAKDCRCERADEKEKAIWYPGRPVDISGLAASRGLVRSEPQKGYVSIWRDKSGRHEMNNTLHNVATVEEGFGGFQQIVKDGKRIAQNDASLHLKTGVGSVWAPNR
jgi:hypothetical protein